MAIEPFIVSVSVLKPACACIRCDSDQQLRPEFLLMVACLELISAVLLSQMMTSVEAALKSYLY